MEKSETKLIPLMLRLPPELRDRLAARAKAKGFSMNATIIEALERAVPDTYEVWRATMSLRLTRLEEQFLQAHSNLKAIEAERQRLLAEKAEMEAERDRLVEKGLEGE